MQAGDFFVEEQNPWAGMNGEPWSSWGQVLDTSLIEAVRRGTVPDQPDWSLAQGLCRLVHRELEAYGTGGGQVLDNEQIIDALRALRAVLARLDIPFRPPFRDYGSFHAYWVKQDMSHSYAARRGYLADLFTPVADRLDELELEQSGTGAIRGVDGRVQNIIFASVGYKPELVWRDAPHNVVEVVEHADSCLIYDRELTDAGLMWGDLVAWWREKRDLAGEDDRAVGHDLYFRLRASMEGEQGNGAKQKKRAESENTAELLVFDTYCARYRGEAGLRRPALLPQVYLHYDPLTKRQRRLLRKEERLGRERMDFLLMLAGGVCVVIEVDGKQHYAEGEAASPRLYAEMAAEDRALRLRGYEVYRFGGYELAKENPDGPAMVARFFDRLEERYGIDPS